MDGRERRDKFSSSIFWCTCFWSIVPVLAMLLIFIVSQQPYTANVGWMHETIGE